ncbi:signal transduction histidine kinase [Paenibacillus anaericanus]|uniref:sensor histidine kinase n=1 Tax=Paenibacillus anaericanus TaxID=170367 RepID=UPI0027857651|nr:HAMP domain-containing sensor histidine kinase [Paenibacillus anaericanus]MDQ0091342.1 signal transduction histidine kinase [Paenibacillus anaericanus]
MKWWLTGRYLLSVVLVVILVIIINIVLVLVLLVAQTTAKKPLFFQNSEISAEAFTTAFRDYVTMTNDQVTVTETGKEELEAKKAWIQILDEDGSEIYSYRLPEQVQKKYTPLDAIQMYKYKEVDGETTVFASGKEINQKYYSYFIGIVDRNIGKYVLSYDYRTIFQIFKVGSVTFIIVDGLIALLIGYFFSRRLAKPVNSLIEGIKRLANKEYNLNYEPKGIYKDVFYNVNYLSNELRVNENERKKLDKMKEEWISNISHDIKTPLASILGYAEMMKDAEYYFSLEEMMEYAEIIESKSLYIKEVIEDLNLTTRLKSKELTLNTKTINMVTLLRNMVIDILNDAKYADRHIEFQCNQETILSDVDEILIRRAINNLIYNAIVHNDNNVKIVVRIEKKERIHITIQDDGKGIQKQELDRIFDRYYRGTNTGELHKGSGLGMAIANDIVKAHHGEIKVNSIMDQGTTIEIQL